MVAIPVTEAIKEIVDLSKTDRLHCPYIVHRKTLQATRGVAKECQPPYQVHYNLISREFSEVRDKLGLYEHLDKPVNTTVAALHGTRGSYQMEHH
ncbi:hypothetical protein [Vibrio mediterranei]|uniref:hypothetical protein n=1 Tax=Vibrio mediterranei TaxID=689 RepID=UPI003CE4F24C